MEFYFDVDGVLLDCDSSFIDMIREVYASVLPPDFDPKSWSLSGLDSIVNIAEAWDTYLKSDRFEQMKPLCDIESINKISAKYPFYLVTNIPEKYAHKRRTNFKNLGLNYTGLYPGGHVNYGDPNYPIKSQVIQRLHKPGEPIVFVDDHPKNCEDIYEHFPEATIFLMDCPDNQGFSHNPDWHRIKTWDEFFELLPIKF